MRAKVKQAVSTLTGTSSAKIEPRLATGVRAMVFAVGAGVFAWPLARFESVICAALGALLGSVMGPRLSASRWRSPTVALAAFAGVLIAGFARWLCVSTDLLAPSFGPATALRTGDGVFFFFASAAVIGGLRALSARRRAFAVLEVVALAAAFAQLVVAHRHGSINRPFELADPILAAGGDPTAVFIAVGAAGASLVVLLLLSEASIFRSLLHLIVVALILLVVATTTSVLHAPQPPPEQMGLGLRPNPEGDGDRERQQSGSSRPPPEDELEFKDNFNSEQERVPVAVVLLHDDYSPPSGVYYLRQGAFSQYNGRRLVAATDAQHDRDIVPAFPVSPVDVVDAPSAGAHRGIVESTVAMLADHTKPFGLEAPVRLEPAPNPDPERFRRIYKVFSAVTTADYNAMLSAQPGNAAWTREDWNHYTAAPEDERYAQLAAEIVTEMPDDIRELPVARLFAIVRWLSKNGTYSLQSSHSQAEDPTAHFLFGDVTGYCVHFAHAATYLLRSAGLPARVATGYALDESSRRGGSAMLVSGGMSHAWPEVYLEGFGWVVTDVSPETVLSPPPPPPDPDLQRLLGELARGMQPVPPDPEVDIAVSRFKDWLANLGIGALVLLVLVLVALYATKVGRWLAVRIAAEGAYPRVVYRETLDRLSDAGIRRQRGESREAFARRVANELPTFMRLTAVHVGAAFGSESALHNPRSLLDVRRRVRSELAQAVPLWRRLVGAITPWTWLTAR